MVHTRTLIFPLRYRTNFFLATLHIFIVFEARLDLICTLASDNAVNRFTGNKNQKILNTFTNRDLRKRFSMTPSPSGSDQFHENK